MKKTKYKWLSLFLVITMICIIPTEISLATDFSLSSDSTAASKSIILSGIKLSKEDFNNAFVGEATTRSKATICESYSPASAQLSNVTINGSNISFQLAVKVGDEALTAHSYTGTLALGANHAEGVNSIVATFDKSSDLPYEIILFNMSDRVSNNLLVRKDLDQEAHFKLYLMDQNQNVFLFESTWESVLQVNPDQITNTDASDLNWVIKCAHFQTQQIPVTSESLLKAGLSTDVIAGNRSMQTWYYPSIFQSSEYVGGAHYVYVSLPYVEYRCTDIEDNGGFLDVVFKISESTKINGTAYTGINPYKYSNVDIRVALGSYSFFREVKVIGHAQKTNSLFNPNVDLTLSIFNLFDDVGLLNFAEVLANLVNMIAGETETIRFGSSDETLYEDDTCIGIVKKLDNSYFLTDCTKSNNDPNPGDKFGIMCTVCSNGTSNNMITTSGALKVTFDVFDPTDLYDPITTITTGNITFNYRVET